MQNIQQRFDAVKQSISTPSVVGELQSIFNDVITTANTEARAKDAIIAELKLSLQRETKTAEEMEGNASHLEYELNTLKASVSSLKSQLTDKDKQITTLEKELQKREEISSGYLKQGMSQIDKITSAEKERDYLKKILVGLVAVIVLMFGYIVLGCELLNKSK